MLQHFTHFQLLFIILKIYIGSSYSGGDDTGKGKVEKGKASGGKEKYLKNETRSSETALLHGCKIWALIGRHTFIGGYSSGSGSGEQGTKGKSKAKGNEDVEILCLIPFLNVIEK